jgi:hypothetical protein
MVFINMTCINNELSQNFTITLGIYPQDSPRQTHQTLLQILGVAQQAVLVSLTGLTVQV